MEKKDKTPQDKWKKKNGYITKGVNMYRSLSDEFALACKKAGVSQSGQIVEMMKKFIEEQGSKNI